MREPGLFGHLGLRLHVVVKLRQQRALDVFDRRPLNDGAGCRWRGLVDERRHVNVGAQRKDPVPVKKEEDQKRKKENPQGQARRGRGGGGRERERERK